MALGNKAAFLVHLFLIRSRSISRLERLSSYETVYRTNPYSYLFDAHLSSTQSGNIPFQSSRAAICAVFFLLVRRRSCHSQTRRRIQVGEGCLGGRRRIPPHFRVQYIASL